MSPTTDTERKAMVDRIAALLAKAERTDNEHEADAFMSKAHQLMDKYRIAMAEVRDTPAPFGRMRFPLYQARHLRASLRLLDVVAKHYGCVVAVEMTGNSKWPHIIGDPDDMQATVMMFGSLLLQRDRFVLAEPVPARANTTRFRNSFCYGYAGRIGDRLLAIREAARASAARDHNSTALAVYDRLPAVMSFLGDAIGDANQTKPTIDPEAFMTGTDAADRADLGQDRVEGGHGPAALPRHG